MVWRVTTIRDGTARHDPVAYITKDDALKIIKSSLDKGVIDSAYIVDPYSKTEDWAAVKKALGDAALQHFPANHDLDYLTRSRHIMSHSPSLR